MFGKITLNLLRIMTGFLLVPHGAQKLFGVLGKPAADLASLSGVAGVLEVFGGLAILLGLFTRPVACVLSGMMAVAYFKAHAFDAFWPILNGGELAALYCFVFFFLSAHGGGEFSIDGCLRSRKAAKDSAG